MPRRGQRVLVWSAFVALLVVGVCIHRDYGYSWDEQISRTVNGLPNFLYLTGGGRAPLKASGEKYHGPAFEIVLMGVEKGLRLQDTQAVYFARHLCTFLVHAAAVTAFYRVLRRRLGSRLLGLAGASFLVLSPRLFADSFYNSKDATFLDAYVFALASLGLFLRSPTRKAAVLHALACSFLIDIRILGVVVPAITVAVMAGNVLARRRLGEEALFPWRALALYGLMTAFFVTLFWPILWHNPPHHFWKAFQEMRAYPWKGTVFYLGREYPGNELPWHYLPCWMAVTTPPLYTLLFAVGTALLLAEGVRRPLALLAGRAADVAWACAFIVPLGAVIALRCTVYDGWRHLYFVCPPLLYLAALGLRCLLRAAQTLPPRLALPARAALLACCAGSLGVTCWSMLRDHPYQNLYFNRFAGPDLQSIKGRFELDYWGLSCRRGLELLLERDTRPLITIYPENPPVSDSALMLTPQQRARLRFTFHRDQADYYLSHYRGTRGEFPPELDFCSVRVGNAKVFVAQKLR